MEVSSTSMNVASVTVRAITQGLTVPSGILSLARTLSLIARFSRDILSRYGPFAPFLYSRLVREHRRVHVHPRAQHSFLRRNRIQHNLHRHALYHFHEISRGI